MDGSAEGRVTIRAICKESSTSLQTLSAITFVLRVSLGDTSSPPSPPAPLRRCHGGGRHPADGPSHRLGHLTFTPLASIIFVADVSFWAHPTGCDHEGTVGRNPTIGEA
jgi:hypothetical protein